MPKTTPTPRVPTFPPKDCTEPSPFSQVVENQGNIIPPAEHLEEKPDNELSLLLKAHVEYREAGVIIKGDPTFEVWEKILGFHQGLRSRTQWIIGDILNHGEKAYGEKFAQAIDLTGKSYSRLQTYSFVCSKFAMERRHPVDILSFDHHSEAASLHPSEADRVLKEAITMRWSKADVRVEVGKINERAGIPKRGRKPWSTAAKVAASGKTPQVPEGEKPLIWNGYPLRTAGRLVYQGGEVLHDDEAELAAHFHKFNHKEGLMNWLEEHNFIKPEGGESTCAQTTTSQCSDKSKSPPSPTASGLDTPEKIASASNGAAPNATESAPTPQGKSALAADLEASPPKGLPVVKVDAPEPTLDLLKPATEWIHDGNVTQSGFGDLLDGKEDWTRFIEAIQEDARKTMPAPPNWMKCNATVRSGEGLPSNELGIDGDLWLDTRGMRVYAKRESHGYMMICNVGPLPAPAAPPASPEPPKATETPLQTCERLILAFNEASKAVDWPEVGRNAARRARWLGSESNRGLLTTADETIDALQNNPPTPRK